MENIMGLLAAPLPTWLFLIYMLLVGVQLNRMERKINLIAKLPENDGV